MIEDKLLQQLVSLFVSQSIDLELLYLFGSQARGDSNSSSDLDLAVRFANKISLDRKLELLSQASVILKVEVDIVDIRQISDVLKVQIIKDGKILYRKSDLIQQEFEMYALSDYARLNEERSEIIADFYKDN